MRVLLVRLDGIGDAAACAPLVVALRAAGHDVGIALTTRNAGIFAPGALLAEHVLERIPWPRHGSTRESTARASAQIAAIGYDVALIASEEPEAFELALPVRERVGFTTGWARPLKSWWVRARTTRSVSRSQRIGGEDAHEVEVLYRLGAGLVEHPTPPDDRAALRALFVEDPAASLRGEPGQNASTGIVVQVGPKWLASGVAPQTQRALFARLAPHARFFAAPSDLAAVRDLAGVEPDVFATTRSWVEALARASAVVTVDTGAAHVAGMVCPTVVDVFPDEHFAAQVRRWRPWASAYRAFRASEVDAGPASPFIEAVLDGR